VALLNVVRNVVLRTTVSFGGSYTLNLTEFFLGCAYIATLFTWTLINSEAYLHTAASTKYRPSQPPASKEYVSLRNITPIEQE
jgi:hypothetical protein